ALRPAPMPPASLVLALSVAASPSPSSPPPPKTSTAAPMRARTATMGPYRLAGFTHPGWRLGGGPAPEPSPWALVSSVVDMEPPLVTGAGAQPAVGAPDRTMAASSVPRYEATTAGCSTTSAGVPSAPIRPRSSAIMRSDIELSSGRACSTTRRVARSSSRTRRTQSGPPAPPPHAAARDPPTPPPQHGLQRFGLPLSDAAGRLFQQQHGRPLRQHT